MARRERPVTGRALAIIMAGPAGCCSSPPCYKTLQKWVDMGMPYVTAPGLARKHYIPSVCIRWVVRMGVGK